jgi:hypothetical protein
MNRPEPTLAAAINAIHESGLYTTFTPHHPRAVEPAREAENHICWFLRHLVRHAAKAHATDQIRERCAPLLAEARERNCIYFKSYWRMCPDAVTLIFNNGSDLQYSRSIGVDRMWRRYDLEPDTHYASMIVKWFFREQPDMKAMHYGLGKRGRQR